jgi:ABC-2 type transport system permease protein
MTFSKYFFFELRLRFRNPAQIFFIFIFPIFLMVAFVSSIGKSIPNFLDFDLPTIMMYAVLSASITSLSVQISEYQTNKLYTLFTQQGVQRSIYMIAQILSFLLVILLSTFAIFGVAHFVYNYQFPAFSKLLIFYTKLILYTIPFYFVALFIGLRSKNSTTASAIATPVMFVSFFLSGMMIPLSQLSGTLQDIAKNFFLTQLLSDLTHTLTGSYSVTPNWSTIVSSILVILFLGCYTYRKTV